MTICESYIPGCECRFFSLYSGKYLGFCRSGELHPLSMPFNPDDARKECGPFRHQVRMRRKEQ